MRMRMGEMCRPPMVRSLRPLQVYWIELPNFWLIAPGHQRPVYASCILRPWQAPVPTDVALFAFGSDIASYWGMLDE